MKPVAGARQYTTGVTYPQPGEGYDLWVFTVPNGIPVGSILTVSSVNHTNAQCGVYKMYLQRPDKTETEKCKDTQPGIATGAMVGKWKLFLKMTEACADKNVGITVNVRY